MQSRLDISKESFLEAAKNSSITPEQADALWKNLAASSKPAQISQLIYYFGAMVVISAMGWFITIGWDKFGGGGIFLIASLYAVVLFTLGGIFWRKKELKLPGGLLVTIGVSMIPLAIFGIQKYLGILANDYPSTYHNYYSAVNASWIYMELGTILAGLIALWFVRFPFITAPIAMSLFFLIFDLTALIFGMQEPFSDLIQWIYVFSGLAMIAGSFAIDRRTKEDYAFWGYFFGTTVFWAAMTSLAFSHERFLFLYCLINVAMMFVSVLIGRAVLMVFGVIGVFAYLSYLAYDVFANSILFPFILSFIGLGIIALGIYYQKNREKIEASLLALVPLSLQKHLPKNR